MKKILLTVAIALSIGSLMPSGAQAITQPVSLEQARNMTGLSWTLDKFLGSSTAYLGAGIAKSLGTSTAYLGAGVYTAIGGSTAFLGAGIYTALGGSTAFLGAGIYTALGSSTAYLNEGIAVALESATCFLGERFTSVTGGSTAFLGAGIYTALGSSTAFLAASVNAAIGGSTAFQTPTLTTAIASALSNINVNRALLAEPISGTLYSMPNASADLIVASGFGAFVIPNLWLPASGIAYPQLATNVNSHQRDLTFTTNVFKGAAIPYVFNVASVVTNQGNQGGMRWGTLTGTVSQDSNVISFTAGYATPLMGKPVAISATTFTNKNAVLGGYAQATYSVGACDNISATLINLTTAGASEFIPAGTFAWGISVSLDSATGFVVVSPVSIQYAQADIGEETGRAAIQVGPNVVVGVSVPPIRHDNQNFPANFPIFLYPGPGGPSTLKLHFWWMKVK